MINEIIALCFLVVIAMAGWSLIATPVDMPDDMTGYDDEYIDNRESRK